MASQSCTFSMDANGEKVPTFFLEAEPIRLILTFDNEYIFRKFRLRREDIVTITEILNGHIAISSPTGY